jgi:Protein of unknown function (DUF3237)
MRLEPLYRARFEYPEDWGVEIAGPDGVESHHYFVAEGRCEGRISGRFHGANHPRRRTDQTFVPDFQGVIEADDGAALIFDMRGYGRAYPEGRRQVVGTVTHVSDDERYAWLNDVVCVLEGEVRARPGEARGVELVLDVVELVWEPIDA